MLEGKTAIITGCNRGIGKAIASLFAENGASLFVCARQPSDDFSTFLKDLQAASAGTVHPIYFDLADRDAMKAAAKEIASHKTPIDILVNNAGAIFTAPFMMTPADKMQQMFEVNYFSQMAFCQLIARQMMRKRRGSIINLSSSAAIEGNEGRLAYAGAKGAVISSTKVMARELGPANIRVNAIAPGLTETDMMRDSTPEEALTETVARLALRRVGKPEEIAGVALFLASDNSSYMTGQVLSVDGGM